MRQGTIPLNLCYVAFSHAIVTVFLVPDIVTVFHRVHSIFALVQFVLGSSLERL